MSKHTPEWEYDYLTSQTGMNTIGYVIYTPDRVAGYPIKREVARVCFVRSGAKRGESPKYHESPEHKAHAALIAASPLMLMALEDILDFLKAHGYDTRIVKETIRKARGK